MLLTHAVALAEARSYLAALITRAATFEASVGYEQVLLDLDALHGGVIPPAPAGDLTEDGEVLYAVATAAIVDLVDHGVDALEVELLLADLEDARSLDRL